MASSLISITEWTSRADRHAAIVDPLTRAFVKRRDRGEKHPVHDFLFIYYNFSPLKLKQWTPSFEEALMSTNETNQEYPWLYEPAFYLVQDHILHLNLKRISQSVMDTALFVFNLCGQILNRIPKFGCFGLHEWAMVYRSSLQAIRHNGYRLRLCPDKLARFVESQTLCCTHYDAYRFFTPEARPRNTFEPKLESRLHMEQAGCVHANMDLYKWSTKLWPWIGSDFIAKAFFLALKARELDMRASPYDLQADGYDPICIETEEGRRQYQQEQLRLTEQARPLRIQLKEFCQRLLNIPR